MSDDPKPKRIGFERKEWRPQHDRTCERELYETPKAMFDAWLAEVKGG